MTLLNLSRERAEARGTHRRPRRRAGILALTLIGAGAASTAGAQRPCDPPTAWGPSRDLYCIELVPAPGMSGVSGRLELGHIPGPFTVAAGADGRLRYQLALSAIGLPPPEQLGNYRSYVGWVAPPTLDSVISQGVVRNGSTTLGVVSLEKFTFLVTAERDARAREPSRKVVLRGQSPATRLFPPDFTQFSLGLMPQQNGPSGGSAHKGHEPAHGIPGSSDSALRWITVPMPPGITMLPSEMALRPASTPWLPSGPAPPVGASERIRVRDGDTIRIEAGMVQSALPGAPATMFAFNRQHPGPLIEVTQGSEITVLFRNRLPHPSAVHWHGIRLENPSDGVPGMTQPAIPPGGGFTYRIRFPDPGIYWYHPHVREDIQQELGLYANVLVRPSKETGSRPAVNQEAVLMLDDLLVNDSTLVPMGRESPTHALMGRFGNLPLVNGDRRYRVEVKRGEVVRFYLTNAAGARPLNLSFPDTRMKLVGSDLGRYGGEEWVESVVIAPAERYIVDVRFDRPGTVPLVNRVRALDHLYGRFFTQTDTFGVVQVLSERIERDLSREFDRLRNDRSLQSDLERYRRAASRAPQKTLILTLETRDLPFLSQRLMQLDSIYFAPVEWSGTMPMMNWASTGRQVLWVLKDPETGRENMDIDWRFHPGTPVRIRLVNERQNLHAMQHPIHFHGQRFLVLSVNGVPSRNLVWKDTVLVPAGGAVDILLDPSNPGRWMAHCHIAEHLSAGMMLPFTVE